jgi:hypothetical protein
MERQEFKIKRDTNGEGDGGVKERRGGRIEKTRRRGE